MQEIQDLFTISQLVNYVIGIIIFLFQLNLTRRISKVDIKNKEYRLINEDVIVLKEKVKNREHVCDKNHK